MNPKIYIHTVEGEIFNISKVVLEEILRVACEQRSIEWPMSCFEDAKRLQSFVKNQ